MTGSNLPGTNLSAAYAAGKQCAECGAAATREVAFAERDNPRRLITELLCSAAACLAGAQHARASTHALTDDGVRAE